MSNPNPKINPFHSEDWFVETIKLDSKVQQSKTNALKQFKSKYHPQISTVSKIHQGYLDFVTFLTSNLIFSSFLTIVILSTFGVSASEILAPREYKPSTFLFTKGNSDTFSSINSSSVVYTSSAESMSYSTSSSVSSVVVTNKPTSSSVSSSSQLSQSSSSISSSSVSSSIQSLVSSSSKQSLKLVPADYNEVSSVVSSSNFNSSLVITLKPAIDK